MNKLPPSSLVSRTTAPSPYGEGGGRGRISRVMRWLRRIRHRCGYGIHSPFAFGFVTDVVYSPGHFYAYKSLQALCNNSPSATALRPKDILLLFRLANFVRPQTCRLQDTGADSLLAQAIRAGSTHTVFLKTADTASAQLTVAGNWEKTASRHLSRLMPGSVLVFIGTDTTRLRQKAWSQAKAHPNARVTFNLGDFGIIFNAPALSAQHYVVNYF